MDLVTAADALWEGDGVLARTARAVLRPISGLFAFVVARRNARFDARTARPSALPAISIGNLTVGGTGKTPVAAWCIQQLRIRGARPAIVMRGVGDDEWRVHGLLNPGTPVIVSADRSAGIVAAKTRGADCIVLDDAFQHRAATRIVDVVLLSADRWNGRTMLLPAGPFREPLSALRRADVVVITVKAASQTRVDDVMAAVRRVVPDVPCVTMRLVPDTLRLAVTLPRDGERPRGTEGREPGSRLPGRVPSRDSLLTHPAAWLSGRQIGVVSAIGDPAAFEGQLRALGAQVTACRRFPDHHQFSAAEARHLASMAPGAAGIVCTLKDGVKLAPLWPREAPPLWYLSQSVVVDRGAEALDRVFVRLLSARTVAAPTAG